MSNEVLLQTAWLRNRIIIFRSTHKTEAGDERAHRRRDGGGGWGLTINTPLTSPSSPPLRQGMGIRRYKEENGVEEFFSTAPIFPPIFPSWGANPDCMQTAAAISLLYYGCLASFDVSRVLPSSSCTRGYNNGNRNPVGFISASCASVNIYNLPGLNLRLRLDHIASHLGDRMGSIALTPDETLANDLPLKDRSLLITKGLISGKWISSVSDAAFPVMEPSSGQVLERCTDLSQANFVEAIDAAHDGYHELATMTAKERGAILKRWNDLVIQNTEDSECINFLCQCR